MTEQPEVQPISEWTANFLQARQDPDREGDLLEDILTKDAKGITDLQAVLNARDSRIIFREAALDRLSRLTRDKDREGFLEVTRGICSDPEENEELITSAYEWRMYVEPEEKKDSLYEEMRRSPIDKVHWLSTLSRTLG